MDNKNRIYVSFQEDLDVELTQKINCQKIVELMNSFCKKLDIFSQEISILFCDDLFIQNLNNEYRKINSPTDVLSFENGEIYEDEEGKWTCAGDIVLSLETLPKNAQYFEIEEENELRRLLLHGLLHLNGYDHGEEHIEKGVEPICEMLVLQEKLLKEAR